MNVAIIPAAGSGTRLGAATPKQFIEIAGEPVIMHTLRRFDACPEIDLVAVALPENRLQDFESQARRHGFGKRLRAVSGGSERSESIANALEIVDDLAPEIVVIHDAVRPFVAPELITAVIDRARAAGAAIVARRATDTIKEVEEGFILRTIDRRRIYHAQTPQAFRYDLYRRANDDARRSGLGADHFTDDAMLVERLGARVAIIEGPASNLKITTPEDLLLAEGLLSQTGNVAASAREAAAEVSPEISSEIDEMTRIGIGYDIHRMVERRKLILGGVHLASDRGLLGHSDGDSLTHAVCDALLGAAGLGDIGTHFSDRDPQYAGIDSLVLLGRVAGMLRERGYRIGNIDATILAERPKMAPHIAQMRARLAAAMQIDESRVNIKAKTNEGVDALGKGDAIAAQAIALIRRATGRTKD